MQYNRMLRISTAGSRKATHWPKSSILWSEFTEKLKMPVRGTETMEEYLAMPKARQAELKDGIFKEHWKSVFDVWEKSQISFTRGHYKKRLLYCRQKHLFRG